TTYAEQSAGDAANNCGDQKKQQKINYAHRSPPCCLCVRPEELGGGSAKLSYRSFSSGSAFQAVRVSGSALADHAHYGNDQQAAEHRPDEVKTAAGKVDRVD